MGFIYDYSKFWDASISEIKIINNDYTDYVIPESRYFSRFFTDTRSSSVRAVSKISPWRPVPLPG